MSFVSFSFLVLFAVVLGLRLTIGRRKTEPSYLAALICASTVFYSWHIPVYILLLLGSTQVDFIAARRIAREPRGSVWRRAALVASLMANLGVLGFFKYADFLLEQVARPLASFGITPALPHLGLALPLGISFYTFQSMSYTIEVYRGTQRPVSSFWQLFLFVSFFPQLVAGPIVRARDFLYQTARKRRVSFRAMTEGGFLIIRGFFLKMVCANNLAPFVDSVFLRARSETNSTVLLLGAVLFGCQIFCDFAGYSSIARGVAYVLGFRLPVNFNNPYLARTFSEFWTRWHITLSQWLRDFLYVPLGGNRISRGRTYVNLMLVMLLGGLWHGAAWTYVIWGALHGGALAIERLLGLNRIQEKVDERGLRFLWFACVQSVVLLAWIVFRCPTLDAATSYVTHLLAGNFGAAPVRIWFLLIVGLLPVLLMHLRGFVAERAEERPVGAVEKALLAGLMLIATLTLYGRDSAFIYFQF
jgi:alginate O-acetyltransferase complex protein AlgI